MHVITELPAALVLLLWVLAIARATRLVTTDVITDPPRLWLIVRVPDKLGYLLTCQWCASMWIAAAVIPFAWNWPTAWWTFGPALVGAASHITGLLARIGGD